MIKFFIKATLCSTFTHIHELIFTNTVNFPKLHLKNIFRNEMQKNSTHNFWYCQSDLHSLNIGNNHKLN